MSDCRRSADAVDESPPGKNRLIQSPDNSNGDAQAHDETHICAASSSEDNFKIEIKVCCAAKAARNDPKPVGYWLQQLRPLSAEEPWSEDIDSDDDNYDEYEEFQWLEKIQGFVTCTGDSSDATGSKRVGFCEGRLIRRSQVRATFYEDMEEASRETFLLAFKLFDRYGRLKSEIKEHPTRKGSGIWNKELDSGDILLIEHLHIDKEHRRRGLGKKGTTAMLEKTREKTESFFAIAWPTFLYTNERRAEMRDKTDAEFHVICQREEDIALRFLRSMGFRRIGSTYWLGLAGDLDHPSHLLTAGDDYNPPAPRVNVQESKLMKTLQKSLVELEDEYCVTVLEAFLKQTPAEDPSWLLTNEHGDTLLHIAALTSKPNSVGWIMNHDFGPRLLSIRNNEGDTPSEALLIKLEVGRTHTTIYSITLTMSDKFEGHSEASVLCLAKLKGLTELTDIELARMTAGCTCGQYISGFLSPRMCLALECQAETSYIDLSHDILSLSGPDWVEWNMNYFRYLPQSVRNNLETNKSMRQGFANLCNYFRTCIKDNMVPTEANVLVVQRNLGEWPPYMRKFLLRGCSVASVASTMFQRAMVQDEFVQRGGSVASVASTMFYRAMVQDELAGDGHHEEVFEEEIAKLPECRNDHEFGFVSGMCGYARVSKSQYAPHSEPIDMD